MEKLTPDYQQEPKKDKQKVIGFMLFEAGIEFALLIALPLLGFIYLGRWLDAKWGTRFLVIIGILLALTVSCLGIYQRINQYKKLLK